jgi:hypothetical protein
MPDTQLHCNTGRCSHDREGEENGAERTFNQKQRTILVSPGFDRRTLSSVAWLIANGVDIICYQVELLPIAPLDVLPKQHILDVRRLLPCGKLEDYYEQIKTEDTTTSGRPLVEPVPGGRNLPRMPQLVDWGVLQPKDRLEIRKHPNSGAIVVDAYKVEYKGKPMGVQ